MPRVDFYIIADSTDWQRFVCQLTGKIWKSGNTVYIHTDSEEYAGVFDDLLWTFHDTSFLPHEIRNDGENPDAPITIGWDDNPAGHRDVLMNLSENIPGFAADFSRIVEVAGGDEQRKQMTRRRYRQYREQDYELHDHKINAP